MGEGLPGVLGYKGTLGKYRREQGNISHFLGTGEQNSKNYKGEQITKMCGNMGTQGNFGREQGNKDPPGRPSWVGSGYHYHLYWNGVNNFLSSKWAFCEDCLIDILACGSVPGWDSPPIRRTGVFVKKP